MKRYILIIALACLVLCSTRIAHAVEGHFWDEVLLTSAASFGNEKVTVHAKLTQGGRPAFELLVITIGSQEVTIPQELSKEIDYPNLRSFLLMSDKKDGVRTLWLSVSPQWKGDQAKTPKFTFEISDGVVRSLIKSVDGRKEALYQQTK